MFLVVSVCKCVSTPNPNAARTPAPRFTSGTPHEQHVHPFRQNSRADVAEVFVAAASHALHPSSCHRGYKQPLRTQLVGSSVVQNEAAPGQQVTPQRENNTLYCRARGTDLWKTGKYRAFERCQCRRSMLAEKEFKIWGCQVVLVIFELLRNKEIWMKHLLKIKVSSKALAPKARLLFFSQ